jgi:hypothetical protein
VKEKIMTSGIPRSYVAPDLFPIPQRLTGVPEDISTPEAVEAVIEVFTSQFGTKELLAWAEWYKAQRLPNNLQEFDVWWAESENQGLIIDMIVMNGEGSGSSHPGSTAEFIRRLREWYLLG